LIPAALHRLMQALKQDRRTVKFRAIALLAVLAALAWMLLMEADRAAAQIFDTKAKTAILVDYDSGTVLFEKNADEPVPPASMAKTMTAEYVFHQLEEGKLSLDDAFPISEYAWRRGGAPSGGSAMYAELGSSPELRYLLRGLIVQSGNDAAIAIAEGIAGSEPAFADLMNRRAKEIGLKDSTFRNANGLHDPEQVMTARDLALLARHIIREYPEYYPIFSEPEFTWNDIRQLNRNGFIKEGLGVDGLKTGFIKESGYSIVLSAVRNEQRLILVVTGLSSERERDSEVKKLLEWGFRSFRQVTAFEEGEVVAEASVYGGEAGRVPLVADGPIRVLIPREAGDTLKARAVYEGPIVAPVEKGVKVGAFKVWQGDRLIQETPLYTAEAVAQGPLHGRALDALGELLLGWL
jgi:D-alanyl-D-alanine carboxypeptidase (penicillin-binding protein 5/6)